MRINSTEHFGLVKKMHKSLLSNIECKNRDLIIKAIELTEVQDIVYIQDIAYSSRGGEVADFFGVHTKDRTKDLSKFWDKYRELKNKKEI